MNIYQANMRITELKLAREAEGKTIDIDQIDIDIMETGQELYAANYWRDNDWNSVDFDFPPGITVDNLDKRRCATC